MSGSSADFLDAAGDVAQRDGRPGKEPADEAPAGLVVAGEQQPQRHHHDRVEHDPHGNVDEGEAPDITRTRRSLAFLLGGSSADSSFA